MPRSLISPDDIDANAELIRSASVFVTQLEQPLDAAIRALKIAREATGVTTILESGTCGGVAPIQIYRLCDYITPNETEAEGITGVDGCHQSKGASGGRPTPHERGARLGDHHARRERRAAARTAQGDRELARGVRSRPGD